MSKLMEQCLRLELIEAYEPCDGYHERIRVSTHVDEVCEPVIERDHEIDPIPEYVDEEWLVNALKVVRKLKKKVELLE